ncbi:MAG: 50S ribosomal protein L13 [Bacteroidetes bacterium]|nr:50S ribosomal protein L13 [Bacteroidota bacterium]
MDHLSYKTISANKATVKKNWFIVNADGAVLGRLSSRVASMIRGKHKTYFTPHVDCGDKVIVINAEKVRLTGKKWDKREYFSHSGYPGSQKRTTPRQLAAKSPPKLIERAIKGMLPKNRLGRKLFKNLYVYEGSKHPHDMQEPKELKF